MRSIQYTFSEITMASVQSFTTLTHAMMKVHYLLAILWFSILIHHIVSSG